MKKGSKEIEVKAKIRDRDALIAAVEKLGCSFSEILFQNDIGYLENGVKFEDMGPGVKILRIRDENGKIILTLKERQEVEMSSIEHETEVMDRDETEKLVKLLGYHEFIKINKKRIRTDYKDYEICIDEVEG